MVLKQGIKAYGTTAYEFSSYLPLLKKDSVAIVFSQSGETADTNEVVEILKEKGVKIISVVNMVGSTLTTMSDLNFMLNVGSELAVASTKAFSGHVMWGIAVSNLISGMKLKDIKLEVRKFEDSLQAWFEDKRIQALIQRIARGLNKDKSLFILSRGNLYYAGLESALKLKEISYIHAEGFSGGELKHGVIALVEKDTLVLCLVAEDEDKASMLNAVSEVKARGGRVIVIASEDNELYDEWIEVPSSKYFNFIFSVIPSQLLTCYMAMNKGLDVDKPRNLAKSVTVK